MIEINAIRACFPLPVGVGWRHAQDGLPRTLFPEEEAALSPRAVERRRLHFSLGRAAARAALRDAGREPEPILRGPKGEPFWPASIVGAITHAQETAFAVVGSREHYDGIGIDLEPFAPGLSPGATRLICTERETAWTVSADTDDVARFRRTMLFSAKEAVFKALYPIERIWLDFHDAELTWMEDRAGFDAELLRAAGDHYPAGSHLFVRCVITGEDVFAATFAPATFA